VSPWRVTARVGPKVEKVTADTLDEALDELEARTRVAATAEGRRGTLDLRYRTFEPGDQVVARSEIRGPGRWRPAVRAGLDVRGDGEVQAWTGRVERAVIEPAGRETAYQALRRTLQGTTVETPR
jgi:hypothetical protein